MTETFDKRDCPLCGAPAGKGRPLPYGTAEFRVVQCAACDQVFLDRLPPQHEFTDERAWEVSSVSHAAQRKRDYPLLVAAQRMTRWRMHVTKREPKNILAQNARPGPIVEVGCGGGVNLLPPPEGFVPYGIEISKSLAAAADAAFQPFGGKCVQAPAIEGLAAFPRGALADDAVVVVKTPNFASLNRRVMGMRWSGFRFPDHVNYFTPQTLSEIARRAGFLAQYGWGDRNPTSDSLWGLLRPRRE
jgi:hypothetical protein